MDNNNEQNIDQLLIEELDKLKKAIGYIEEAKKAAATSAELIEKVNTENMQLQNTTAEIKGEINTLQDQLEKAISENNKKLDEKLDSLWVSVNEEFKKQIKQKEPESNIVSLQQIEKIISDNNKLSEKRSDALWTSIIKELNKTKELQNSEFELITTALNRKIKRFRMFTYISISIILAILIRLLFS